MNIGLLLSLMPSNIIPVDYDGLCFTAEQAGSTVKMAKYSSAPAVSLQTSTNGVVWSDFIAGSTTITLANVGDKVYFRAGEAGNTRMATNTSNYNYFVMSGKIAASGNVMSLLDASCQLTSLENRNYAFCYLFKNCTSLTQAPELPATTLATYCYYQMFTGCTSLIQAPELLSTTLTDACYLAMFYNCTSLTKAPELPATTLAGWCYQSMFNGCTSLSTAPALPATTLADNCYYYMFYGCSALTTAPELPATTLANNCYGYMFYSCSNLSSINVNFSAWNPTNATTNWVYGVKSSGTFTCPTNLTETRGTSKIPSGWTVVRK